MDGRYPRGGRVHYNTVNGPRRPRQKERAGQMSGHDSEGDKGKDKQGLRERGREIDRDHIYYAN